MPLVCDTLQFPLEAASRCFCCGMESIPRRLLKSRLSVLAGDETEGFEIHLDRAKDE